MTRVWTSSAAGRRGRPHEVCVVAFVAAGTKPFVPRMSGGDAGADCMTVVVCEDEQSLDDVVEQQERARRVPLAGARTDLVACIGPAPGQDTSAVVGELTRRFAAHSYLLALDPLDLDALGLQRVALRRRVAHTPLIQFDLARAESGQVRFPYGDFLRYRTYMSQASPARPTLPLSFGNLLLDAGLFAATLQDVATLPARANWRRLLLLELLARHGEPPYSHLLVGLREVHADSARRLAPANGAVDTAPELPPDRAYLQQRTARMLDAIATCPGEYGTALRAVTPAVLAGCEQDAQTDGLDQAWLTTAMLPRCRGWFGAAAAAAKGRPDALRALAALLADAIGRGGLPSMEVGLDKFEQQLVRVLHDACAARRFAAFGDELMPFLDELSVLADVADWPIEAADLAWCFIALTRERREVMESGEIRLAASSFARLEAALSAHLGAGLTSEQRIEELEAQVADLKATLAEWYPGRLGTLLIEAIRGSGRYRLLLPWRLLRLAWSVLVVERRALARVQHWKNH